MGRQGEGRQAGRQAGRQKLLEQKGIPRARKGCRTNVGRYRYLRGLPLQFQKRKTALDRLGRPPSVNREGRTSEGAIYSSCPRLTRENRALFARKHAHPLHPKFSFASRSRTRSTPHRRPSLPSGHLDSRIPEDRGAVTEAYLKLDSSAVGGESNIG